MLPAGSTCICTRKNDDFPKRIKFRLTHYHITNELKGGGKNHHDIYRNKFKLSKF